MGQFITIKNISPIDNGGNIVVKRTAGGDLTIAPGATGSVDIDDWPQQASLIQYGRWGWVLPLSVAS